jgi:hypothetical protein
MSHHLVLALFRDVPSAAAAARDVHALGVKREDLSVVARNHRVESAIAAQIDGSPGTEIEDSLAASHLGELSGYVLAAIAIGFPGTGAVVAAGPLAAGLGELAGHVAGGLKATLMKAGVAEAEADRWKAQIESGRAILLGVHVRVAQSERIESALARHGIGQIAHTQWED